jgi:hypothetical protein
MAIIINGTTGISDVDGSASVPAYSGTDSNTGMFFPAADTIAFAEGGVESMRIDSAGRVGIGITSPVYRLQLNVSGGNGISLIGDTNNEASVLFGDSDSAAIGRINYDNSTDSMRLWTNSSERMRIDSSGNVGIGTTDTSGIRLGVNSGSASLNSNFTSTNASGVYVRFQNSGTSIGDIGAGGSVISGGTVGDFAMASRAGNLVLGTGSVERMRINSSGNLLVGTTSPGSMSASSQPVVVRSGATGIINARNDNVANSGTLDITVSSGGGGFAGLLVVQNINLGSANNRTQTTFSVLGRGTDAAATQITTRNGSVGGASFSVTFPSAGLIRITNTSGGVTSITASFFGNEGF